MIWLYNWSSCFSCSNNILITYITLQTEFSKTEIVEDEDGSSISARKPIKILKPISVVKTINLPIVKKVTVQIKSSSWKTYIDKIYIVFDLIRSFQQSSPKVQEIQCNSILTVFVGTSFHKKMIAKFMDWWYFSVLTLASNCECFSCLYFIFSLLSEH